MKRTLAFLMMFLLLLLSGCARTAPYEVKHGFRTYVIDPVEGTVTRNGHTCSYEVTIRRGIKTRLVLRYPSGEWMAIVGTPHSRNQLEYSEKWYSPLGKPDPDPALSDLWAILDLEDAERPDARVELYAGLSLLLVGLFCVFWPDKVPFTGNYEDKDKPATASLRACRIIGAVCIAVGLVLAGLYALRITLEFYRHGGYPV
ncbi:MAG: hypothetical protein E7440_01975 [Ruminococcaceae bacterium]|nr:hypothetical protein [Oscillospiraceae bacterium]